ncbi:hypothetical protein DV737_g4445, partial [Chaetothyriales sp. CBS 132003]
MDTAVLLVSNVHCPSCVSYIQSILGSVAGVQANPDVSLIEHTVRVHYDPSVTNGKRISDSLLNAAFEVKHVTELDSDQHEIKSYEVAGFPVVPKTSSWSHARSKAMQKHIDNCTACQREKGRTPSKWKSWAARSGLTKISSQTPLKQAPESSDSDTAHVSALGDSPVVINVDGALPDETRPSTYVATISIGGMTCSACTSTVTQTVTSLDNVVSVDVNLVSHSAKVVYSGTDKDVATIVAAIDDAGYDATLVSVDMQKDSSGEIHRMKVSITGMTCGSCVGAITRGLQELPSIRSVSIDLVGNSGAIEYYGKDTASTIIERIEDLGYDAEVSSITSLEASARPMSERTVQIKVEGMYCQHCPQKIVGALERLHENGRLEKSAFRILQEPTMEDPIVTVVYRPSIEDDVTVRRFISSIEAADPALAASVYQPPTLEERSRRLQQRERNLILARLLFTTIVAIPTFIIGVVFMSLVPSTNHTRQWFEQPIWAGMAMRMDWALFIMTTPVMLFGSDMFHKRAIKEIRAMWGPKSRVPLLRRFYHFGSMNLLISAGTSVAYFSSLAVLILDATDHSDTSDMKQSSDSYFDTVVFLTLFLLIGKYLEAYSKAKTGNAVAMLSSLRPTEARLVLKHATKVIPVNQLEVGDVVQLAHGQSPPADSVIDQDGVFLFDESSLTGESKPVKKGQGDEVFTGSVNTSDAVRIRIRGLGGSSMLDRIIDVVREGQSKRAPIERFADVITGYFAPIITLIAIITWVVWLSLGVSGAIPSSWMDARRGGWPFWSLEFAIAVFVVACPCGIGLAAPTALFVGGGLAAKNSILVQGGGEAFQEASQLTTIVFDKTGTLTQGQMKVSEFEAFAQDWKTDTIKAVARILEDASNHPIAKAISEYCADASVVGIEHSELRELPGMGMAGTFTIDKGRVEVAIGNERLLSQLNTRLKSEKASTAISTFNNDLVSQRVEQHQSLAHSTAIFAVRPIDSDASVAPQTRQFQAVALFSVSDPLRPEADSVIGSLRESGIEVHMCTGDNATTARAIAGQLGIPVSNVRAGVLPQDKAAYIQELQHASSGMSGLGRAGGQQHDSSSGSSGRAVVGFVGDGTNDTPALSTADVSIALSSGSDIAVTSSSFILLNPSLHSIPVLIRLSKRVFRRVKFNFVWAAVYNVVLVPIAAGVLCKVGNGDGGIWRLSPVWASVAMACSSVSVVASSLALRLPEVRWKRGQKG